ncbi:glycosyltransferase family protein [Candidatus Kaiserbacteria bacterium]|nr:glycosyltransferase family protein [Candidatus Kaiserbacteria bacterium]
MITTIIQARVSSARLPGKVLLPLLDTTVLGSTIREVQRAKKIASVVVATSDQHGDDAIADAGEKLGVPVFRGSLDDVLDRYYKAAKKFGAEHICRVTADCPLIDPDIIDRVAAEYEKERCDYISTGRIASTFPDGMDAEIFSFIALERAWREAKLPSEREHVTPYIWRHPELFAVREVQNDRDLSRVRLTLDEPADYEVLKRIVAEVRPLSMNAIVRYLETHPEVAAINQNIMRDEGYTKSLKEDTA